MGRTLAPVFYSRLPLPYNLRPARKEFSLTSLHEHGSSYAALLLGVRPLQVGLLTSHIRLAQDAAQFRLEA